MGFTNESFLNEKIKRLNSNSTSKLLKKKKIEIYNKTIALCAL